MADRLSWLALLAALTFSLAVVLLGRGSDASEPGARCEGPNPASCGPAQ